MGVNIPDTIHWVPGTVCRKWSVASDCARWRCPHFDKAVVYMDGPWHERFRDSFVHFVSSAALISCTAPMRLIAEVRFKFLNFELQHVWNWTAAKEKGDSPTFAAFPVNLKFFKKLSISSLFSWLDCFGMWDPRCQKMFTIASCKGVIHSFHGIFGVGNLSGASAAKHGSV